MKREKMLTRQDIANIINDNDAFNEKIGETINAITATDSYQEIHGITLGDAVYFIYKCIKENNDDYLLCVIITAFLIDNMVELQLKKETRL